MGDSPGQQEQAVKFLVSQAAGLGGGKRHEQVFSLLYDAVGRHVVTARLVCETVLNCDKLVHTNHQHWIHTFNLVRRIVAAVDYKVGRVTSTVQSNVLPRVCGR